VDTSVWETCDVTNESCPLYSLSKANWTTGKLKVLKSFEGVHPNDRLEFETLESSDEMFTSVKAVLWGRDESEPMLIVWDRGDENVVVEVLPHQSVLNELLGRQILVTDEVLVIGPSKGLQPISHPTTVANEKSSDEDPLCPVCHQKDIDETCYTCRATVHPWCSHISGEESRICFLCLSEDRRPDPFTIVRIGKSQLPTLFPGETVVKTTTGRHPHHRVGPSGVNSYAVLCGEPMDSIPKRICWLTTVDDDVWWVEPTDRIACEQLEANGFLNGKSIGFDTWCPPCTDKGAPPAKAEGAPATISFVASLSTDVNIACIFKDREDHSPPEEDTMVEPSIRPEYPRWYQPFATDKRTVFQLITPTFGEMNFVYHAFSTENTAIMPGNRGTRKFYALDHCKELIKGYCVFGLFANSHQKCKYVYVAYTKLVPKAEFVDDDNVLRFGDVVYVRAYLTMCNKPRVDHAIYSLSTKDIGIWQGYALIKMYNCAIDEPLGVDVAEIDRALNNYYGIHAMHYKPDVDNLRM